MKKTLLFTFAFLLIFTLSSCKSNDVKNVEKYFGDTIFVRVFDDTYTGSWTDFMKSNPQIRKKYQYLYAITKSDAPNFTVSNVSFKITSSTDVEMYFIIANEVSWLMPKYKYSTDVISLQRDIPYEVSIDVDINYPIVNESSFSENGLGIIFRMASSSDMTKLYSNIYYMTLYNLKITYK